MKNISLRFFFAALSFLVGAAATDFLTARNDVPPSNVEQVKIAAAQNRSGADEFDGLFYALRSDNNAVRNNAVSRIYEILNTNPASRRLMTVTITGETSRLCMQKDSSDADFDVVQILAPILAELQATEALDMLIDCSNWSQPVREGSINYATMPGIIKYGQSAIPTLERKLNEFRDSEIKFQVAAMLAEIGGNRAKRILNTKIKEITGGNAARYFKDSAKRLKSADTSNDDKRDIADELTLIVGNKAQRILSEARQKQSDKTVSDYLDWCLERQYSLTQISRR